MDLGLNYLQKITIMAKIIKQKEAINSKKS